MILSVHSTLRHNIPQAIWQEYELAKAAYRTCLNDFLACDQRGVNRLASARERKARAEVMGWKQ